MSYVQVRYGLELYLLVHLVTLSTHPIGIVILLSTSKSLVMLLVRDTQQYN